MGEDKNRDAAREDTPTSDSEAPSAQAALRARDDAREEVPAGDSAAPAAAADLSEEKLRQLAAIIESSDDAIISNSLAGIVQSWNPGAVQLYGYEAVEMIGRPLTLIFPAGREGDLDTIMAGITAGERLDPFETVRMHKNGAPVHVLIRSSPIHDAAGRVIGASSIARDITDRNEDREALEQLRRAADQRVLLLETARRVALDILASRTGVEALRHIAEAARTLSHARYAALGVARADGSGLMEFAAVGMKPELVAAIGPQPRGVGLLGMLLRRDRPLRLDNLADHPGAVGFPPNHPPMTSFLGVPIRRGDTVLGSLYLTEKEGGGAFTESDEAAVWALGDYAAVAIHNLHLLSRQRALVRGLIDAQEEERRAVAYDLHDGLTQYVMAAHAHLESFRHAQEMRREERAARELGQGLRYLKEAVMESRRLVNGLRSLALDDLGLAGAMEQLVPEEKARAGWDDADFIHNVAGRRFDPTVETVVYRVAQEALTNVRKHAEASRVRILLLLQPDDRTGAGQLIIEVRDWGKGFVPEQKTAEYTRLGLQGMAERVSLVGGAFELESAPGEGTTVRAVIPVPDKAPGTGG